LLPSGSRRGDGRRTRCRAAHLGPRALHAHDGTVRIQDDVTPRQPEALASAQASRQPEARQPGTAPRAGLPISSNVHMSRPVRGFFHLAPSPRIPGRTRSRRRNAPGRSQWGRRASESWESLHGTRDGTDLKDRKKPIGSAGFDAVHDSFKGCRAVNTTDAQDHVSTGVNKDGRGARRARRPSRSGRRHPWQRQAGPSTVVPPLLVSAEYMMRNRA
jgi:hypothetical protein